MSKDNDSFHDKSSREIVDIITKSHYIHNMVVILAGFGGDMDELMKSNEGLRSRFPTQVLFLYISPIHYFEHLKATLEKLKITFIDCDLTYTENNKGRTISDSFMQLSYIKGWANGRNVETIANNIIGYIFMKASDDETIDKVNLHVSFQELMGFLVQMLRERNHVRAGGASPELGDLTRRIASIGLPKRL
ncbi:unnamed protein product [Clonostachys chloroleuca]|uniref:Uncharacterized protein n=1 Tax=Clonostachys chloroleuca TaxID=1926264 RepID=A0AA35QCL4_9HYPO|nr:unnamed protein product [Clonostachys chloroleuca]